MTFSKSQLVIAFAAIVAVGGWLRLHDLGDRPLQFDEAVNWHLSSTADYSPENFHGPLYFKLLKITGRDSERDLRLVSAVSGTLLIAVPVLLLGLLPNRAIGLLMLLIAVDPLLLFYSRAGIHESLFVLLGTVTGFLSFRFCRGGSVWLLAAMGICAGLLVATKETFPIVLVAILAGSVVVRRRPSRDMIVPAAVSAAAFFLTCVAAFGDLGAPIQILKGVISWTGRGFKDQSQVQPWWYFFGLLFKTDPGVLIALVVALLPARSEQRYFLLWGLALLAVHSLIPYKTPWLALSFAVPLYAAMVNSAGKKVLPAVLSVVLALGPFDETVPTANDTSAEVPELARRITAHCEAGGSDCRVLVNLKWYWPLPFYLRDIQAQVAYSSADFLPHVDAGQFQVLILPAAANRNMPGWRREEVKLSRLQTASVYWRLPLER